MNNEPDERKVKPRQMEPPPFKMFQRVWIMRDNQPTRMFVVGFFVHGVCDEGKNARLEYVLSVADTLPYVPIRHAKPIEANLVFKTKKELLESL